MVQTINTLDIETIRRLESLYRKSTRDSSNLRRLAESVAHVGQFEPFAVRLESLLLPGGSSTGLLLTRRTDSAGGGERVEASAVSVPVVDPLALSFGFPGDDLLCVQRNGLIEPLPRQGIYNVHGRSIDSIASNATGSILLYPGSGLTTTVTARNVWRNGFRTIGANEDLYVDWRRDWGTAGEWIARPCCESGSSSSFAAGDDCSIFAAGTTPATMQVDQVGTVDGSCSDCVSVFDRSIQLPQTVDAPCGWGTATVPAGSCANWSDSVLTVSNVGGFAKFLLVHFANSSTQLARFGALVEIPTGGIDGALLDVNLTLETNATSCDFSSTITRLRPAQ